MELNEEKNTLKNDRAPYEQNGNVLNIQFHRVGRSIPSCAMCAYCIY